jgi:hypothetical protein
MCTAALAESQDDSAPADTAAFVPYCTDHFDGCRTKVITVNNLNKLNQMRGVHGCTFPSPHDAGQTYHSNSIAATNAILDWLKANSASQAQKPTDAINQAMAALWPSECK